MAQDYENVFDLDDLSDDELRGLVRDQLEQNNGVDVDNILVQAKDGHVTLSGRVGTESEKLIADHVLSDVIGLEDYSNELFIDEIRRDLQPEAADDAAGEIMGAGEDSLLGTSGENDGTADAESVNDNDDAALFGTHDYNKVVSEGVPWIPPDEPTPEGRDVAE